MDHAANADDASNEALLGAHALNTIQLSLSSAALVALSAAAAAAAAAATVTGE